MWKDVNAFLHAQKLPTRVVPGGATNRAALEYERPKYDEYEVPASTTKYAKPFVDAFKNEVWKRFDRPADEPEIEKDQPVAFDRDGRSVYDRYDFDCRLVGSRLPIENKRREILRTIAENTVSILYGPTGCGKTTRVPQFILDDYKSKRLHCNIVVAQPRRIAAASNAKRVCDERGWRYGSIVGYQVGADKRQNCSDDTRVLYCTTGVLVEKLSSRSQINPLDEFTHIILDEVHERDKEMDFLMIIIYKYLNPKIRIILMSATINIEKFAKYYEIPQGGRFCTAPYVDLRYERPFTVQSFFLDDLESVISGEDITEPYISEQMYKCAVKLIVFFERLDRNEWEQSHGSLEEYKKVPKPTVLVFLPGIFEIKQLFQRLETWHILNRETRLTRIVMHSTADDINADVKV